MIGILITACDRFRRQHSIARRQRRKRMVACRLIELRQLEVELENLILLTESPVKDNIALIRMFYAEIGEAALHFRQLHYREAKKSRSSARTALLCIRRNIDASRRDATTRFAIN